MQENTDMKSIENAITIYILLTKKSNLKEQDFNSDTIHKTAKMFFYAEKMTGNRHKKHPPTKLPTKHINEPKV